VTTTNCGSVASCAISMSSFQAVGEREQALRAAHPVRAEREEVTARHAVEQEERGRLVRAERVGGGLVELRARLEPPQPHRVEPAGVHGALSARAAPEAASSERDREQEPHRTPAIRSCCSMSRMSSALRAACPRGSC
jgi:hypothetical protein